ncbi:hypothetical protein E2C01_017490 [Portunus trituberculatus]|uniref:Uncharacterized protein n=1 Tax=Portunus trituberculatus TaxID=210409 RepID=A0A5B7DTL2_PORTR|nr:hypothetical protein [Portunus trituberculatus]
MTTLQQILNLNSFTFDSQYQPAVKDASTDDVGFLRSSAKHPPPTTARAALTRTPAASRVQQGDEK